MPRKLEIFRTSTTQTPTSRRRHRLLRSLLWLPSHPKFRLLFALVTTETVALLQLRLTITGGEVPRPSARQSVPLIGEGEVARSSTRLDEVSPRTPRSGSRPKIISALLVTMMSGHAAAARRLYRRSSLFGDVETAAEDPGIRDGIDLLPPRILRFDSASLWLRCAAVDEFGLGLFQLRSELVIMSGDFVRNFLVFCFNHAFGIILYSSVCQSSKCFVFGVVYNVLTSGYHRPVSIL